jgi:hypothetical protein
MLQTDVGLQAETARVALERLNKEVKRRADVVAMIPNEGIDHPTDRRRAAGAKRRMAVAAPLHAGRGNWRSSSRR